MPRQMSEHSVQSPPAAPWCSWPYVCIDSAGKIIRCSSAFDPASPVRFRSDQMLIAQLPPTWQAPVQRLVVASLAAGQTRTLAGLSRDDFTHTSARHWNVIATPRAGELDVWFQPVDELLENAVATGSTKHASALDGDAHVRFVIDHVLSFVGVLDLEGTLWEANETALRAGGLRRDEVIGKKFWECGWWSYDETIVAQLKHSIIRAAQGEVVRYDVPVRVAGDRRLMIDFMLSPVRDESGQIIYLVPSGVDISDRVKATADRLESEERFRTLADNISQLAWMADEQGNLFWYNQRWFDYTGTTLDEVQGWGWERVHHPEHLDRVKTKFQHACSTGEFWEDVFPLRSSAGEYRWFLSRAVPICDPRGKVLRWFGTNTDITEQKRAEDDLERSRQRLSLAMTLSGMGSYDWTPSTGQVIWDEQHVAITGMPSTVMTGADFLARIHPDDVERNRVAIERTLAGEADYDIEFRFQRPDGRWIWLGARGNVIPADLTSPARFVGVNWDVTAQKEAAEQLQRSETRLQRIIQGSNVGIVIAKRSGEVLRANDAALSMLAISRQDFSQSGLNWHSFMPVGDESSGGLELQQVFREGTLSPTEFDLTRSDGTVLSLMVSAVQIEASADECVIYLVDLTQQKEQSRALEIARLQAETANRAKSEFIANLSHEIRTPMTAVLGYTDLLMERAKLGQANDPDTLEYLETIKRNGQFLLDIINDILDLSKIEAGKIDIDYRDFSLQDLLEDVYHLMQGRADEKKISFAIVHQNDLPLQISSDSKRLKQILVNLLGNAIKFTNRGGVRVEVRYQNTSDQQRSELVFAIHDSGIGMTREQLTKLFQPFSQGDMAVNRVFGGTGLGLAISQRLSHLLGGNIQVQSEFGKGSTFVCRIPVTDSTIPSHLSAPVGESSRGGEASRASAMNSGAATGVSEPPLQCRILVVDDRRDIRLLSKTLLVKAGATVAEAEDGLKAVDAVARSMAAGEPFDLILLDMQMPKLDGYQTATHLRAMGYNRAIVALTAEAMQGDMVRCLSSGCNDYLSKPIDVKQLLSMVRRFTAPPST